MVNVVNKKYKIGFQMNPIGELNLKSDTTIRIVENYFKNGNDVFLFQPNDVFLEENIVLSLDRMRKDIPDLSIINPKEVIISSKSGDVKAIMFNSNNALTTGSSLEVWFIKNKVLFQMSSTGDFDKVLNKILETWEL